MLLCSRLCVATIDYFTVKAKDSRTPFLSQQSLFLSYTFFPSFPPSLSLSHSLLLSFSTVRPCSSIQACSIREIFTNEISSMRARRVSVILLNNLRRTESMERNYSLLFLLSPSKFDSKRRISLFNFQKKKNKFMFLFFRIFFNFSILLYFYIVFLIDLLPTFPNFSQIVFRIFERNIMFG